MSVDNAHYLIFVLYNDTDSYRGFVDNNMVTSNCLKAEDDDDADAAEQAIEGNKGKERRAWNTMTMSWR